MEYRRLPERIHSEKRAAILEVACLKKDERGASAIKDFNTVSVYLRVTEDRSVVRQIRRYPYHHWTDTD